MDKQLCSENRINTNKGEHLIWQSSDNEEKHGVIIFI
jgi:hypothetical protein